MNKSCSTQQNKSTECAILMFVEINNGEYGEWGRRRSGIFVRENFKDLWAKCQVWSANILKQILVWIKFSIFCIFWWNFVWTPKIISIAIRGFVSWCVSWHFCIAIIDASVNRYTPILVSFYTYSVSVFILFYSHWIAQLRIPRSDIYAWDSIRMRY